MIRIRIQIEDKNYLFIYYCNFSVLCIYQSLVKIREIYQVIQYVVLALSVDQPLVDKNMVFFILIPELESINVIIAGIHSTPPTRVPIRGTDEIN